MLQIASSSRTLDAGAALPEPIADDRLPTPQAALIVVSLSLGLWTCIGLLARWLIG